MNIQEAKRVYGPNPLLPPMELSPRSVSPEILVNALLSSAGILSAEFAECSGVMVPTPGSFRGDVALINSSLYAGKTVLCCSIKRKLHSVRETDACTVSTHPHSTQPFVSSSSS